jgi:hypothetical protein
MVSSRVGAIGRVDQSSVSACSARTFDRCVGDLQRGAHVDRRALSLVGERRDADDCGEGTAVRRSTPWTSQQRSSIAARLSAAIHVHRETRRGSSLVHRECEQVRALPTCRERRPMPLRNHLQMGSCFLYA